jgi:hypothetical protein
MIGIFGMLDVLGKISNYGHEWLKLLIDWDWIIMTYPSVLKHSNWTSVKVKVFSWDHGKMSHVWLPKGKNEWYWDWLVLWHMAFMTFHMLGMSSSQLTNSIFQRGRSTTNQERFVHFSVLPWTMIALMVLCDSRLPSTSMLGNCILQYDHESY